jgi:protein subunit release factor B
MPKLAPQRPPPYALDREILEREVEMQFLRASGPGGQHVNKTESALRLTHWPSGVVLVVQDSSSQHRNRDIAFERLVERLKRLNYVKPRRVPTKPTKASRKRRLEGKKQLGVKKQGRARVRGDE